MNKSDSERFASKMEDLGYQKSRDKYEADFVIINTCGVRQTAEDRIYGLIPGIKKKNKKVKIIITGCLVYRKDVQRRLKDWVDFWIPIQQISNFQFPISKRKKIFVDYLKIKPKYESSFSAFVPIGNGCNNFCTYCVVPYARGREVYRSVKEILDEVKYLISNNYKEIILIAQNVNSYQVKVGQEKFDFADLLKMVDDIPGNFWIRFATSHPKDMSAKLIKTIANCKKVCRHIHLPAQAGDNKILEIMNRGYTVEQYKSLIKKIRAEIKFQIPNSKFQINSKWIKLPVAITTDIIVGFPGETKKQFNKTKKLFREVDFDMAYISQYSSRPGTVAEKLNDDISKCEKREREEELTKILRKSALENNKKYLGKVIRVLVEGKNKNNEWFGKTETNKTVKFSSIAIDLTGSFVHVKISRVEDFGLTGVESSDKKILVILGSTASGKTKLAVKLAKKYNGEIVSADSRQVYCGMDIGTGKDLDEYGNIPYHLIDIVNPKEQSSLAEYQKLAFKTIDDILSCNKLPILVGGSGLYLQAVVDNYLLSEV